MLVKAIKNTVQDLPAELQQYAFEQSEGKLPLTIEKKYVVAGIRITLGHVFYLVVSDYYEKRTAPWWYPQELFSIIDNKIPNDWVWGGVNEDVFFAFPELANDITGKFENDLEDADESAMPLFRKKYDEYTQEYDYGFKGQENGSQDK